eukprot:SAG31_NODE_22977_length_514_cov_0.636145_1_plen_123_part_00
MTVEVPVGLEIEKLENILLRVTTGDESKQEPADIEAAVNAVTTLTPEEAEQTVAWLANRMIDDLVPVKIKVLLLMKTMVAKAGPVFQLCIRGLTQQPNSKGAVGLIQNLKAAGAVTAILLCK